MFLRQSTASQEITLGPFLDDTDGKTAETGLTIANTDIKLWKSGGTTESDKNSGGATHIAGGRYYAVLDATDTDTVGMLEVAVSVSGALPVRRQFYVLEEAVYDQLFAGSAAGYQVPIWSSSSATVNLSATTIKTATDVEVDTQDIQSRLPAALVDGRIAANAQVVGDKTGYTATVSDKTGFKLASDGLALVTSWTVAITGNLTGNVTGSVGSISGVTFPDNFGSLGIDPSGSILVVDTVMELDANALTAIANAVAATQALSRLDSMIESDGAGQFRFDTIALEMAPAGGGGGGTDWTANERTAIRSILGIPTSGTTPADPTVGILDEIRDDINAIGINVYPVQASTPERVAGTTLTFYRNESRSVSVVTDFTLTNLTLQFTVEDQDGVDVYTLANGSISRSGQTFTVAVTTAVTGNLGQYRWSMRDITGGGSSVIAMGVLTVQEAASSV